MPYKKVKNGRAAGTLMMMEGSQNIHNRKYKVAIFDLICLQNYVWTSFLFVRQSAGRL